MKRDAETSVNTLDECGHVNSKKLIRLIWRDPRERQTLFKILCATGARVEFGTPCQSDVNDELYENCRLAVLDYDSLRNEAKTFLEEISRLKSPPPVLVVTASRDKQDLIDLLSHEVLTNLVAKNVDLKASELVVTVQKILRNDMFGLEKYLTWGVEPISQVITSSADKTPALDRLEEFLQTIGINRRLTGLAKGVADEFLMNAVYNAPVDVAGRPKYSKLTRAVRVDLSPGEESTFRYACDGRVFALSIQDNFGRLGAATVRGYLRKCFVKGGDQIDDKEGGAGLGLYYIFESLNHLVINVLPGQKTEMIGLMDVSGSFREFAERPKSLNLFFQENLS